MKTLAAIVLYLLENWVCKREPDFIIAEGYGYRWFVIPRNRYFNIYFHLFEGSDHPVHHDHPWYSCSFLLEGSYLEHAIDRDNFFRNGHVIFRSPEYLHWLQIDNPCKTLFITGPKVRSWGFLFDGNWMYWRDYLDIPKPTQKSKKP